MSKRIDLRKYWANKAKQGRLGDSEMRVVKGEPSHVNPIEADIIDRHGKTGEEIVTQIGSGTINPKTGYREYVPPWLILGGIYAGTEIVKAGVKRHQSKKLIKEQKTQSLRAVEAAGQLSGEEARAMGRMRKGAEKGTMNVEKMTQQVAQPLYQQGQAQVAEQMGIITSQGLEGSIMAQEVSRKVGADVRAKIAGQARQISLANERTKAESEKRYQDSLMRRGQLMRDIASQKIAVEGGAALQEMASKQEFAGSLVGAGLDLASAGTQNYVKSKYMVATKETHPNEPSIWGKQVPRTDVEKLLSFPPDEYGTPIGGSQ